MLVAGEKYLDPDCYTSGENFGDARSMFEGHHLNVVRWCDARLSPLWQLVQPMQDTAGCGSDLGFGSPHANSFNMAFCDGSVHGIGYTIDATTCSLAGQSRPRPGDRREGLLATCRKRLAAVATWPVRSSLFYPYRTGTGALMKQRHRERPGREAGVGSK